MKRFVCIWMVLLTVLSCAGAELLPEYVQMTAGESLSFELPFSGKWDSDAPEVAYGDGDTIHALQEGYAMLYLMKDEDEVLVEVEVVDAVPAVIRDAINIALQEWEALGEKRLDKTKKGNKFIKWWGYENIGWCGAFANYCMDTAGVPLEPTDTFRKVKPHEGGIPYSVREAGVPKIRTAFTNMERLTNVPKPGYLIIYGARDYYADVHVGIVTDVWDRGNGEYQVFTVEGNVGSAVKRFSFLYNANAEDQERNLTLLPEEEWLEPEIYHYDDPRQTSSGGKKYKWYVTCFCATWE